MNKIDGDEGQLCVYLRHDFQRRNLEMENVMSKEAESGARKGREKNDV